ncbi:hypothetical protein Syun_029314 [Stephania yunnanensis]|uniref:Uncharacterized protein n=1 Tax=Stephania yunnanensis TaxID=152371 RepID=A0AAP0E549_9MAGN
MMIMKHFSVALIVMLVVTLGAHVNATTRLSFHRYVNQQREAEQRLEQCMKVCSALPQAAVPACQKQCLQSVTQPPAQTAGKVNGWEDYGECMARCALETLEEIELAGVICAYMCKDKWPGVLLA